MASEKINALIEEIKVLTVLELAEREGLGAHGNAIRVRFE